MSKRSAKSSNGHPVRYEVIRVRDLNIFYRAAGNESAPAILLLHGFPTSSNMFRNLIPLLAGNFRVIAPDLPGFGQTSMPDRRSFTYSFENIASVVNEFVEVIGLQQYSLYVMDYGAPIGFRLAMMHPTRVKGLVIQNGNAYEEGLGAFWASIKRFWSNPSEENRAALGNLVDEKTIRWQYEHGVPDVGLLDPTSWLVDMVGLNRPGNAEIQMDLLLSYPSNIQLYPEFQDFFRRFQPPALVIWGKNDEIFPVKGAVQYSHDLRCIETHLFDTGHFALETHVHEIADLMLSFLLKHLRRGEVG